ncbi:hypothetical protein PAXRUDRAFT_159096 [Paxillus rubicundulus Ve08.2h10]|uniref:Uncharacterized protein n=1 Tax=Paxillus rubicundulus Ve08.2h10 TaxID=930991 RepID=A0A0D0CBQ8_9AGAM|nr:hypothetical protein PAXRUDRAFT_159096 [Paxillus rubicundulus Ve08.2h10]
MATTVHVNTVPTTGGFKLDSLCVSIHLTGSPQSLVIPECIPIRISADIPHEFLGQISPMVLEYTNPQNGQQTPSRPLYMNPRTTYHPHTLFYRTFFPFFPLPPTFNLSDRLSWQALIHQIQLHLIQLEDNLTSEEHITKCLIVCEFFWMAFVAAFPSFPYGDWPDWNPRITMDGDFISYWISDTDVGSVKPESVGMIWEFIWEELKALAIHVLPPDIVSEFFGVT